MYPKFNKGLHHIHIIIHGDFTNSGLGFSALFNADKEGITGYMRYINLTTVEIEAEGTQEQLTGFVKTCKKESCITNITTKTGKMKYFSDFNLITKTKNRGQTTLQIIRL